MKMSVGRDEHIRKDRCIRNRVHKDRWERNFLEWERGVEAFVFKLIKMLKLLKIKNQKIKYKRNYYIFKLILAKTT